MKLFTGDANPELAKKISEYLNIPLGKAMVTSFSEGEISVRIDENVRGQNVFVIQPTSPPPNKNIMELLIIIDALRRASSATITAVIPYYGYARQDRKDQPRVPITAKLVANLITAAGCDRVVTLDLHAGQIQGFFDIPVDNLYAEPVFVKYFQEKKLENFVVVSPDVGGIKRARGIAKKLQADLAMVDKRRISSESIEVMNIMGDIKDKNVIITDDIIATAGSLSQAARALKEQGALDIYVAISHAILSGQALERIKNSPIKELVVTDTIPLGKKEVMLRDKIKVISVAELLGEAINRIHHNESVSSLFI
ncbi:ribose-phosphate diphosphokinase [Candidatus Auribacterota bacterium]